MPYCRRMLWGQIKVMLSTLDPLALPVGVSVVDGSRADDPLYLPALQQVHASLGTGLLHVGDSKMAAREIRAHIVSQGDFYLCPLPTAQREDWETSLAPVHRGDIDLIPITRTLPSGKVETVAYGYTRDTTLPAVEGAAADLVTAAGLESLLLVTCHKQVESRCIRAYKDRPARTEQVSTFSLTYHIDEAQLGHAIDALGWRVYAI